jgi:hypothetical protein
MLTDTTGEKVYNKYYADAFLNLNFPSRPYTPMEFNSVWRNNFENSPKTSPEKS